MLGVLELQVLELLAELPRLQVATEEAAAWPRAFERGGGGGGFTRAL